MAEAVRFFGSQQAMVQSGARGRASTAAPGAFASQLRSAVQQLAQLGENVVQASPVGKGYSPAATKADFPYAPSSYRRADETSAAKEASPGPAARARTAESDGAAKEPAGQAANGVAAMAPADGARPASQVEAAAPVVAVRGADGSGLSVAGSGAVAPASAASAARGTAATRPMALHEFPRPSGDNGRGMHWIPTTHQPPEVVDRYVAELKAMKVKWVVFLNEGTQIGANDYLVSKLTEAGIMPVMRIYTPGGAPIEGDIEALVKHYLPMGVHYYQLYNEPNLSLENQGQRPSVKRYLDAWIPAAKAVVRAGGLPGFGALAPGGEVDDLQFLREALSEIVKRGERAVLDHAWLSMHNYMFNRPVDYERDSNGFAKYRWYDQIVREVLGRSLPIIGTEGGAHVGAHNDGSLPPLSEDEMVQRMLDAYARTGSGAEPYNFVYTYWLIANEAGGGTDPQFTDHALFHKNGTVSPLVEALKRTG